MSFIRSLLVKNIQYSWKCVFKKSLFENMVELDNTLYIIGSIILPYGKVPSQKSREKKDRGLG